VLRIARCTPPLPADASTAHRLAGFDRAPGARPFAAQPRPLRRKLGGDDHYGAGDCQRVQDRTAALRLSKRGSLCCDAIHHAELAGVAGQRQHCGRLDGFGRGAPGARDQDDGG
jgi:hypothetical protein